MLNIGRLAPGGESYYLATVAVGVEDYYTASREAPGVWLGGGAADLALEAQVTAEQLRAVLGGCDPKTGEPLGTARNRRVPGFDLTFRAPKSVSIVWALADEPVARQVVDAHDAAVAAALGWIEAEVLRSRRGHNGAERVEVTGAVAAAFHHRTSRATDPLLHTHVLVANLARASDDGLWRTVDSRSLYRAAKTAGYLYQASLRHQLTLRLGVEWGPVSNGCADLAGVPREVIDAFSTRRADILEVLDEVGEDSARAAQVAALSTRRAKDHDLDLAELVRDWHERAAEHGLEPTDVAALLERQAAPTEPRLGDVLERLVSPDGLTAHASTFDRNDVLRAWAEAHRDGATIERLTELTDLTLSQDVADLVPVLDLGRSHGEQERFTTPELLAVEQQLLVSAISRRGAYATPMPTADADALVQRSALSDEQVVMVRRLLTETDGVQVVVGKPGAGKTAALAVARRGWERANVPVVGCALAARTARQLEEGSAIRSTTIARLLTDLDHPEQGGLVPGSVLVVDEAGMVGTRTLARLVEHAEAAGAKLVLVGDPHQLPEIDAGGAFAALARGLPAIELSTNRRQVERWEREALDLIRAGDPAGAIDAYTRQGRIHRADSSEELRHELVSAWHSAVTAGTDAIMLAARRDNVTDLNRRAQCTRLRAGETSSPAFYAGENLLLNGDRIVCLRNDPELGVTNGARGTIVRFERRHGSLAFKPDGCAMPVTLPQSYLNSGGVALGYAITVHKAQGLTCDATYVLTDQTLTREWAYVALSRGRHTNDLFLDVPEDEHAFDREGVVNDDLDEVRLAQRLGTERRQQLATRYEPLGIELER